MISILFSIIIVLSPFTLSLFESRLLQTVSIIRHGARYHTNSIYDGNSTLSMKGELTSIGMRQQQSLGKIMRQQYVQKAPLLSSIYNQSQIELFSTNYNRTLQSAISHLYGMYPNGNGPKLPYVDKPFHLPPYKGKTSDIAQQNFALPLGLQPVQVKVDNKVILADCDNWDELVEHSKKTGILDYNEMNMTYYPFLKRLGEIFPIETGRKNDLYTLQDTESLWDTLLVDKYLGRPLPLEFSQADFNNLQHLHNWYYTFILRNDFANMINTYKFKKILSLFDNRLLLPQTYAIKMTIMSAHDTDTAPLLTALNISSFGCIEQLYRKGKTDQLNCETNTGYASNIVIQLHSENNFEFQVKIRSNGKYVKMCGADKTECEYWDWKSRVKKTLIQNVEQICKISKAEQQNFPSYKFIDK